MSVIYTILFTVFSFLFVNTTSFAASDTSATKSGENICIPNDSDPTKYTCYINVVAQAQAKKQDETLSTKGKVKKKKKKRVPQYNLTSVDRKAITHFSNYARSELIIESQMYPTLAKNIGVLVCANYMNLKNSFDKKEHILKFAKKISNLNRKEFFDYIKIDGNLTPIEKRLFLKLSYLSTAIEEPNNVIVVRERRKGCF